jgi:hypothetical protein
MMRDRVMKAHYWKRAKKAKLPNAYTAAIQDYMTRPKVNSMDFHRYSGQTGGRVVIQMKKRESPLSEVMVTIMNREGQEIERGKAQFGGGCAWVYKNTVRTKGLEGLKFIVDVKDHLGNATQAVHSWNAGEVVNRYRWIDPPMEGLAELMGVKVSP